MSDEIVSEKNSEISVQKIKVNRFWSKFQKYLGTQIPEFILNILIGAGYDNALSLSDLNEDDIVNLEVHVTANPNLISCVNSYDANNPFHFLPGHKKTLLSLSEKCKNYLERGNVSKNFNVQEEVELLSQEVIEQIK